MTAVISRMESAVMGLNFCLFNLITYSLIEEKSECLMNLRKHSPWCKGYACISVLATQLLIFIVNFIGHYVFITGIGLLIHHKKAVFI